MKIQEILIIFKLSIFDNEQVIYSNQKGIVKKDIKPIFNPGSFEIKFQLDKKSIWSKDNQGPSIIWEGTGLKEIGRRSDTNEIVIKIDSRYFRPTEVD